MEFSDNAKALLLLTGHLGNRTSQEQKPLTLPQWNRLRKWLDEHKLAPQDLFNDANILQDWAQKNVPLDKVHRLLNRGLALAEASLRWQQAGIWITTYLDKDFPYRITNRIDRTIPSWHPPLFFGVGNRTLIQGGGIAVVGSRNAPQEDLEYTRQFGRAASDAGEMIISGGAKGVDITAMNGCLEQGGQVIGVLSDNLLRRSMEHTCRDYLEYDHLLLLSRTDPEVKLGRYEFSSAAMERNKYIYCLSDAAVVVRSGMKGGTISGAKENLKHSWVPLWVKSPSDIGTANEHIISEGARELPYGEHAHSHLQTILAESFSSNRSFSTDINQEMLRHAVILLTVQLEAETSDQVTPMDIKEWEKFALYLRSKNLTPAHLINRSLNEILQDWDTTLVTIDQIRHLIDPSRQSALLQQIKNWSQASIDVAIRSDKIYPKVLKEKLGHNCPPVLFIVGGKNLSHLRDTPKISVMGSTKSENSDLDYAISLGDLLATEERVLISTCTSKIEKSAIDSSLNGGGKCILITKEKMQQALRRSNMKENIVEGQLIIISPSPPQAKSNLDQCYAIANCLSSSVIAVRSGKKDIVARCINQSIQNQWSPVFRRTQKKTSDQAVMVSEDGFEYELIGENAKDDLDVIIRNW